MTDYTVQTNFGAKDGLASGNAAKVIRGAEFTTEFNNIATAVGTKVNKTGDTFSGAVVFSSTATFNDAVDINDTKVKLDGSAGQIALGTNTFYTYSGNAANSVLTVKQTEGGGNMPALNISGVQSSQYGYSNILSAAMTGSEAAGFELNVGSDIFSLGGSHGVLCVTTDSNPHFSPRVYGQGPFSSNNDAMDLGTSGNRWRHIYLTNSPNVSSDRKLKENIEDADDAGSLLDSIQIRKFDWIEKGEHQSYGVVAQELAEVFPEATSVPQSEEDTMGVTFEKLIPMLIKEVQSLRSRVAELENV